MLPAVHEESFHFELFEDEIGFADGRSWHGGCVVGRNGAAHGNPTERIHLIAHGRTEQSANLLIQIKLTLPSTRFRPMKRRHFDFAVRVDRMEKSAAK